MSGSGKRIPYIHGKTREKVRCVAKLDREIKWGAPSFYCTSEYYHTSTEVLKYLFDFFDLDKQTDGQTDGQT